MKLVKKIQILHDCTSSFPAMFGGDEVLAIEQDENGNISDAFLRRLRFQETGESTSVDDAFSKRSIANDVEARPISAMVDGGGVNFVSFGGTRESSPQSDGGIGTLPEEADNLSDNFIPSDDGIASSAIGSALLGSGIVRDRVNSHSRKDAGASSIMKVSINGKGDIDCAADDVNDFADLWEIHSGVCNNVTNNKGRNNSDAHQRQRTVRRKRNEGYAATTGRKIRPRASKSRGSGFAKKPSAEQTLKLRVDGQRQAIRALEKVSAKEEDKKKEEEDEEEDEKRNAELKDACVRAYARRVCRPC